MPSGCPSAVMPPWLACGIAMSFALSYLQVVEMPYGADYEPMLLILTGAVSQLETNQRGTLRLDPDSYYQVLFTEE